jgi:hypothetical protein
MFARTLLTAAWLAAALPPGVARGDEGPAPSPAPDPAAAPVPAYDRALPLMAQKAIERGYALPLPYGAALVLTGLGNRQIDVTDIRVGLSAPPRSVSDFVSLGSHSDVFNANLKFDAWLLPFLNVYALVGYVHNRSMTHARVSVPQPGPLPGTIDVETDIPTELDGVVGGVGTTLAAGYRNFYLVLDASFVQSNLGFDNAFRATIASLRAGYQGRLGTMPLQMWLGVGDWDTAATATGHADLGSLGSLTFEADQRPHTRWMYDVGCNLEFSKRWQLVLDVGADFQGGYYAVAGPTLRF